MPHIPETSETIPPVYVAFDPTTSAVVVAHQGTDPENLYVFRPPKAMFKIRLNRLCQFQLFRLERSGVRPR
jgi:hypothetical protein